jgi:hypothetical protein
VVRPAIVRLPLSGDDWIDVLQELNAGEYYDYIVAMSERKPFSKVVQYLVGWSLVGLQDQPLPYSLELPESVRRDTLRSLDQATIRELVATIDRHEQAQDVAKKKIRDGVTTSLPTFASVS